MSSTISIVLLSYVSLLPPSDSMVKRWYAEICYNAAHQNLTTQVDGEERPNQEQPNTQISRKQGESEKSLFFFLPGARSVMRRSSATVFNRPAPKRGGAH